VSSGLGWERSRDEQLDSRGALHLDRAGHPIKEARTQGDEEKMNLGGISDQGALKRVGRFAVAGLAVVCLALLSGWAPSSAGAFGEIKGKAGKEMFKKFVNCPISRGEYCTYAETLSGEFKIGSKTSPIEHPIILQGGLPSLGKIGELTMELIPPLYGAEELSRTPQTIPGGLTGLSESIGGPVTATAELAKGHPVIVSPAELFGIEPAVTLPIKIHLENQELGEDCYIGSDENPIVLHLTDSTTAPPEGTEPIRGKRGESVSILKGRGLELHENTLVDNTFAVPAATGCGTSFALEPIVTALVNANAGLPAAAGKNVAILNGNIINAQSRWVATYDRKEIKAKATSGLSRTP